MKKRYLLIFIVFFSLISTGLRAQMFYSFVDTVLPYTASSATATNGVIVGTNDEGWVNNIPLFPFIYNSMPTPFTSINISTNGIASFSNFATAIPGNDLLGNGGANRPIMAPLWDDLKLNTANPIKYETLGAAPNRIFVVEWQSVIFPTNATPTTASLSMEMKLYESYNVIDFAYTVPAGGSIYANASASIGLTGIPTAANNFMSVQAATNPTTVSTVTSQNNINTDPQSGMVYRWLPTCPDPTGITTTCISSFSADISWAAPTFLPNGVAGYEYIVDQVNLTPTIAGTPVPNNYVTAVGLSPLTQYFVHVRTDCGMGNYSAWQTVTFTTAPPCNPPLLYVSSVYTNVNTAGATVNWSATGVTDYEWVLDLTAAPPVGNGALTQNITKTFTGLLAGTTYYYHIRSKCSQCNKSPWVTVSFTTPPRCTQPLNLAINNVTSNSAYVTWDPVAGAVGYQYSVTQSFTPPAAGTFTTATNAIAGGMLSGSVYYVHVRTDCDSGNYSPWSTETFTTVDPTCKKPKNVHETGYTQTTATFAWSVVLGNTGYEVVVDQNPIVLFGEQTNSTGFPGYTATGLTPNTDYYFHVRTKCDMDHHSLWVDTPFRTDFPVDVNNLPANSRLSVSAYPNPTGDMLTVTVDGPQYPDATLVLTDINGKIINYVAIIDKKAVVDLTQLPQALYFVKYVDKFNTEVIKVYKR